MAQPHFGSDNASGVAPEIMDAIGRANHGGVPSYGNDESSARLESAVAEIFETDVTVLPVATGTIANCLSLALITPPWGAIYCHSDSHIVVDEANGPEFYSGGAKLIALPGKLGRLSAATVEEAARVHDPEDVHHPMPATVSVTQASEHGTLYSTDELRGHGDVARKCNLAYHMDGARFANAVASLNASPADLSWRTGVEVLSLGATKNGCLAAEAIVLFGERRRDANRLLRMHKRAGQLFSKMRFFTAQLLAYLENDNWIRWAAHANQQARTLAVGLASLDGVRLLYPVEANEIFVSLPLEMFERMQATGFGFYPISPTGDGHGTIRLVTSFNTEPGDVLTLLAAAGGQPDKSGSGE